MTQELTALLLATTQQATFDCGRLGKLTASQLRTMYPSATGLDYWKVAPAEPHLPNNLLAELIEKLGLLLADFIADDYIGYALPPYPSGAGRSRLKVEEFARIALRASAFIGPERVAALISGWAQGKPIQYQEHAVFGGLKVSQPLEWLDGARFATLPNSTAGIRDHLPWGSVEQFGVENFLGEVKLSILCEVRPALYSPRTINETLEVTWAYGKVQPFSFRMFCEALSLSCNHRVALKVGWSDYGDLVLFHPHFLGVGSYECGDGFFSSRAEISQDDLTRPRREGELTIQPHWKMELTQEHLARATDLLARLGPRPERRKSLRIAIDRWLRSKRDIDFTDQFIELRIALEALYATSDRDNLRFQVANHGAWHLGSDFAERSEYHRKLRKAYDHASKAVHGSEIEYSQEKRIQLAESQDLCRKGILKRLDESKEPDGNYWNELILGKDT